MLVNTKELTNLKLKAIKADDLKELAASVGVESKGSAGDLIKKLIDLPQNKIDAFIKTKYQLQVRERQKMISDNELIKEVQKVTDFNWGVVQGQLDQKNSGGVCQEIFPLPRFNQRR